MFIGIIYSIVILIACILGAIVGLSGGLFFRPIFDAMGHHNVMNIGFFASTAILFMAIVSTIKKIQDGTKINPRIAILISLGAILGGVIGNLLLEHLLAFFPNETAVQFIQIALTVMVLIISLIFTAKNNLHYELKNNVIIITLGILLGTIASFLGIGGGPLNVPIFMIFFGLGIKDATAYSIVIILFAHLSRLITLGLTVGYLYFDLAILPYVIVAASLGGLIGAKLTKVFSDKTVKRLFQATLCLVMLLNIASGLILL